MTFSLRFTADLTLALAVQALSAGRGLPPVLQLNTDNTFDSDPIRLYSAVGRSADHFPRPPARISRFRSPVIWIGGSEPLDHLQMPRATNAIAASGHYVFLETSGASLKQRLHEFRPSSRFYFTVRFEGRKPSDDARSTRDGAFAVGLEAIRMARLAGFFTCAHLVLHKDTEAGELEQHHAEISKLDVDGFLITPGRLTPELREQVRNVRRRLLNRRWALLSSLLHTSALTGMSRTSPEVSREPLSNSPSDSLGESAEAR